MTSAARRWTRPWPNWKKSAPAWRTKLVLPGPKLDGASLHELMESERVTVSAGVAHLL